MPFGGNFMEEYTKNFFENLAELSKATYSDNIICFLDLLGYKNKLLQSKTPSDLFVVNSLKQLEDAIKCSDKVLAIQIFSDSIYIACSKNNIDKLLEYVTIFSFRLLIDSEQIHMNEHGDCYYDGYQLLRGGITLGKSYFSDKFILGPAIARAYELESEIAKFPRIIIDKNLQTIISKELQHFIKLDCDEEYFLDYFAGFDCFRKNELNNAKDLLERCNKFLQTKISCNNEECKVIEKYKWFCKYIDNTLKYLSYKK